MARQSGRGVLVVAALLPLLATGCGGGGSGIFGLFGTGVGATLSEIVSLFGGAEGANKGADGTPMLLSGLLDNTQGLGNTTVPFVHNPEPASMALFGGGLLGLALVKRRKSRKSSSLTAA